MMVAFGRRFMSHFYLRLRVCCLPFLSLTRTPGGHHLEWCSAFFSPLQEFCEKGVYFVGLLCFFLVICGISMVVGTYYIFLLPFLYATLHPIAFSLYFVFGNYLLIMICFHYFSGVYTSPGKAPKLLNFDPNNDQVKRGWKICHKCEAPKPPRTHHCRICNCCVLKMDHHCPWLFNCVGHFNHRFFMMFVVYMWIGTLFVIYSGWSRIYILLEIRAEWIQSLVDIFGIRHSVTLATEYPPAGHVEAMMLCLQWFVCVGVAVSLSILGGWNMFLISAGINTIEFYTNKRDAREMKSEGKLFCSTLYQVFVNHYHYGFLTNWTVFLGLLEGRSFIRHVLLPSLHKPLNDGMDWDKEVVFGFKDKVWTVPV